MDDHAHEQDRLAHELERHRPHLRAVAYRMLGSLAEADDAIQDAQTLAPAERLAYVLHDMFDVPFAEIAPIVDRTPDTTRQLASRGRRRVRAAAIEPEGDLAEQAAVVQAYLAASREGDLQSLIAVLAPDVELRADGGAGRPEATVRVRGAEAVAGRALAHARLRLVAHPVRVNGAAGVVFTRDGSVFSLMPLTVSGGQVAALHIVADPERLARLELAAVIDPA